MQKRVKNHSKLQVKHKMVECEQNSMFQNQK